MGERKPTLSPFTVIYGGETYLIDQDLNRARSWSGRQVILLDGEEVNGAQIADVCLTPTFDGSDRTVIVDNGHKVKADKTLKAYLEGKDPEDGSIVLVVACRSDKLPDVWGPAVNRGRSIEHAKFKTWDNNNEVIRWIPNEAKRLGIQLEEGVAEGLYKLIGNDLYKIVNELRKLAILVGKGGKVSSAQMRSITVPVLPVDPYKVVEATLRRDRKTALNSLSFLYRGLGDEASIIVCISLMRQIEKVVVARHLYDSKMPEEEIASALEMHAFRFRNFMLPIVKMHDSRSLRRHMDRLCKLEIDVKGASRSKRTLVELAVLSILQ